MYCTKAFSITISSTIITKLQDLGLRSVIGKSNFQADRPQTLWVVHVSESLACCTGATGPVSQVPCSIYCSYKFFDDTVW